MARDLERAVRVSRPGRAHQVAGCQTPDLLRFEPILIGQVGSEELRPIAEFLGLEDVAKFFDLLVVVSAKTGLKPLKPLGLKPLSTGH